MGAPPESRGLVLLVRVAGRWASLERRGMGQHSNSTVRGAESLPVRALEVHMLQRRTFISGWGYAGIAALASSLAAGAWAQRVTNPIARPPRGGGPLLPGRFDSGGVASGALPGIYV